MSYDMSDFYTNKSAELGVKYYLYLPNGEKTDHYLIIKSINSKDYQRELSNYANKLLAMKMNGNVNGFDAIEEKLKLAAKLVKDWSFSDECNYDEVLRFLKNAPQVIDGIEAIANDLSLFCDNVSEEKKID